MLLAFAAATSAQKIVVEPFKIQAPPGIAPAPACGCQSQCEAVWAEAAASLEEATGMRLRTTSNFLLETYVANQAGRFSGRVMRRPTGGGTYAINSEFLPWSPAEKTSALRAETQFRDRLRAAAAADQCPIR